MQRTHKTRATLKTLLKINQHKLILPTPEEDALIAKRIAEDPYNPEWTAEDFASVKKASELLPALFGLLPNNLIDVLQLLDKFVSMYFQLELR